MFFKNDVCQHLAALKTGQRHYFYVFVIQVNVILTQKGRLPVFKLNFSKKDGERHPRAKCWQTYPPNKHLGGYFWPINHKLVVFSFHALGSTSLMALENIVWYPPCIWNGKRRVVSIFLREHFHVWTFRVYATRLRMSTWSAVHIGCGLPEFVILIA